MTHYTSTTDGGMLTHSGRRVSKREGVPSLEDIALSLSRIPRFGGHGRTEWSVLNHSLVCQRIAAKHGYNAAFQLEMLLHDAHEAVTGDIPTPVKTQDVRLLQAELDGRILSAYFPGTPGLFPHKMRVLDLRALYAEACTVGPPSVCYDNVSGLFGGDPLMEDVAVVKGELALSTRFGQPVEFFSTLVGSLQKEAAR